MTRIKFEQEWMLDDDVIHLNHAAVAPWPKRTQKAIEQFTHENLTIGSRNYLDWIRVENNLRQQLAQLINAPSTDDIALLKNTSEGLSVVAYGLDWRAGDNVVISNEEFPSNRIVWESLRERYQVEVRYTDLSSHETPEQALISACDERTRLLSISSVQYATGLKVELDVLGSHCAQENILFCVDAIQSLGALSFDVQKNQADFVIADAHKWMLGPEGVALFYVSEDARDKLHLNQYGWHMVERMGDYSTTEWDVARSARRFECGSPNTLGIHAFNASLSLILEIGIEAIESSIIDRVQYLDSLLEQEDRLKPIMPAMADRYSGIRCFDTCHKDVESVYKKLQNAGVLCALRGGGIRFSPHYYTPKEKIKQALELAAN